MADPYGETCPAAAQLCVCGVRGCDLAALHASAFVIPRRATRGRGGKQRRYGRKR